MKLPGFPRPIGEPVFSCPDYREYAASAAGLPEKVKARKRSRYHSRILLETCLNGIGSLFVLLFQHSEITLRN